MLRDRLCRMASLLLIVAAGLVLSACDKKIGAMSRPMEVVSNNGRVNGFRLTLRDLNTSEEHDPGVGLGKYRTCRGGRERAVPGLRFQVPVEIYQRDDGSTYFWVSRRELRKMLCNHGFFFGNPPPNPIKTVDW